ncbi:MAG: acyl carrier protein [Chloroflexi bacterium]|nr:acyl carrier protein [Chloroflexota bacterium]MCZ6891366.1 acyl carrier protein [Chloroflexota bacterium]
MSTVFERMQKLVADRLGVEEDLVVANASFTEDLNADSLDLVELIMAFEEEFSQDGKPLEIPDEDAERIMTIQNAVDYLKEHGIQDE